jgi:mRNA interferase RelE/StbE
MLYELVWEPAAINAAARFLGDDAPGLRLLIDALDDLAAQPRPGDSFAFGSPDVRRIRVGRYRCLYQVSDHDRTVVITHIGRSD